MRGEDPDSENDSVMALACGTVQTHSEIKAAKTSEADEAKLQGRLDIPDGIKAAFVTEKQMIAAQQADPYCKQLIDLLKNRDKNPDAKHYTASDNLLCRVTEASDPKEGRGTLRPYVPVALRPTIIRNHHGSVYGCHKNARGTYQQVCITVLLAPDGQGHTGVRTRVRAVPASQAT